MHFFRQQMFWQTLQYFNEKDHENRIEFTPKMIWIFI